MRFELNKKPALFICIMDYSMSPDGSQFVLYESQTASSNNFHNALNTEENKNHKKNTLVWDSWLSKKYQDVFMLDFDASLNLNKAKQREILSDSSTTIYNPAFIVIKDASQDKMAYEKCLTFLHEKKRIVIKFSGSDGDGNTFIDLESLDHEDQLKKAINNCKDKQFVVEEQVMFSPLPTTAAHFPGHLKLGVYYRDIVIYNPNTNEIEFIEVYQNILNTEKSMDSHSLKRDQNLEEIAYLLRYTPNELNEFTEKNREKYPEFYQKKEQIFKKIASLMFRFTLSNQDNFLLPPKRFIRLFHNRYEQRYIQLFQHYKNRHLFIEKLSQYQIDWNCLKFSDPYLASGFYYSALCEALDQLSNHRIIPSIPIVQQLLHIRDMDEIPLFIQNLSLMLHSFQKIGVPFPMGLLNNHTIQFTDTIFQSLLILAKHRYLSDECIQILSNKESLQHIEGISQGILLLANNDIQLTPKQRIALFNFSGATAYDVCFALFRLYDHKVLTSEYAENIFSNPKQAMHSANYFILSKLFSHDEFTLEKALSEYTVTIYPIVPSEPEYESLAMILINMVEFTEINSDLFTPEQALQIIRTISVFERDGFIHPESVPITNLFINLAKLPKLRTLYFDSGDSIRTQELVLLRAIMAINPLTAAGFSESKIDEILTCDDFDFDIPRKEILGLNTESVVKHSVVGQCNLFRKPAAFTYIDPAPFNQSNTPA